MAPSTTTIGPRVLRVVAGLAAATLCVLTAGCSDDDSASTTTSEDPTRTETSEESTDDTVDQLAGPFELTTADGSIGVAGTVEECLLIDGSSAQILFTGSVQDVTIEADGGTGSVTIRDEFDGEIESAVIDTTTGDVKITGTAPGAGETTRFEVTGRCET